MHGLHVERDVAEGLHRVGVEEHAVTMGDFADLLKREAFELKAPNASHTLIFYLLDIIGDRRIDPDDNSVFNCDSAVRL